MMVPAPGRFSITIGWPSDLRSSSPRSEEHTSELQSRLQLVCRLLLEKKRLRHQGSYQHPSDSLSLAAHYRDSSRNEYGSPESTYWARTISAPARTLSIPQYAPFPPPH